MAGPDRKEADERNSRMDMILEELRLNTEDMKALADRARAFSKKMRAENRLVRAVAERRRRKA
jgi:hypothetical protein